MTPHEQGTGYLQITLQRAYKRVGRTVHSLVMEVYGPSPPSPQHDVINHIDGNKQNNHIENLEWVTEAQNRLHAALLNVCEQQNEEVAKDLIATWITHA